MWNYIKKLVTIVPLIFALTFPMISMGAYTYGSTLNGASSTTSTSDTTRVSSAGTNGMPGKITAGHGRFWISTTGTVSTRLVVYSDVAGAPTTLLGYSDTVVVSNTSEAQIDYTFSTPVDVTANTVYWIGMQNGTPSAGNFTWSNDSQTGLRKTMSPDTFSDGPNTTFTESTNGTGPMDIFMDVTTKDGSTYPLINSRLNDSGLRMDFDGVDERLTSASNPSYSSDTKSGGRTICMWFNLDTLPASETHRTLFSWSNSDAQGVWNFRIRTDRAAHGWSGTRWELQTALDTGAGTGSSTFVYSSAQTFAANTDYNICLVSSGTAWTLYVNGSSTTLTVGAAGSGGNDGDWWGDVNGSGTITFFIFGITTDGKADQVSLYNDDLTAAEVSLQYNGGKPIHPLAVGLTDLAHLWKLGESDDGSVTTLYDSQGTDNYTNVNMENADIVPTSYY